MTLQNLKCNCDLCKKIRELGRITTGGWADPRRGYNESEEHFLDRVPDGFIEWPENHIGEVVEPARPRCLECGSENVMVAGRCTTCYSCGASTCSL